MSKEKESSIFQEVFDPLARVKHGIAQNTISPPGNDVSPPPIFSPIIDWAPLLLQFAANSWENYVRINNGIFLSPLKKYLFGSTRLLLKATPFCSSRSREKWSDFGILFFHPWRIKPSFISCQQWLKAKFLIGCTALISFDVLNYHRPKQNVFRKAFRNCVRWHSVDVILLLWQAMAMGVMLRCLSGILFALLVDIFWIVVILPGMHLPCTTK